MIAEINLRASGLTDKGLVRSQNEDALLLIPDHGVFIVADGMGGHNDGRFASQAIVESFSRLSNSGTATDLLEQIEDRLAIANDKIFRRGQSSGKTVGSTVAILLVFSCYYACLWSGDSRIYLIRNNQIKQITKDHTEVQELIDAGMLSEGNAVSWPRRNVITRAIGVNEFAQIDIEQGQIEPRDLYILCSDGLHNLVSEEEMLAMADEPLPDLMCCKLVNLALERGAADNVTVVVVSA
ncbi:Protein phosphatase PrpC [Methylobacterium crusticola]|uniref:Protein phosphatase PrpC n=1 Tax=Methylobacterium crusticola TaxID=1697972 RepID=A0ABQ4QX05_9HYPH|nr:protein phosphatase 2C domain-containing protein [Methylobacterium crusticola]GJD49898.1 Protein phosphatase PrpC [Methylobacterium crusticola]